MRRLKIALTGFGLAVIIGAMTGMAAETPETRVVKEFPSYEKAGRRWRNVVISPGASIDALAALAQRLHAEDPRSSFRIFTDGKEQQFRRFRLWDVHYTKDDSARYPYPEAWGNRHYIAMIHKFGMRSPRGPTQCWKLQINQGQGVNPPVSSGHSVDLEPCR